MIVAILSIVTVLTIAGAYIWLNRPVTVEIDAGVPIEYIDGGFPHAHFERLLEKFVDASGHVDYERWHASRASLAELEGYLAAVAKFSPDSHPERYPTDNDALAYWLYAYNAYVIYSIVTNWPLESITDLKAPIESVRGRGFFHRLRFRFGGTAYSLVHVEKNIICERYEDPRIHFVLNCGTESCPPAPVDLPVGEELESMLARAARDFVMSPAHVAVDDENSVIALSPLFEMYEQDFVGYLRLHGRPTDRGVVDYIASVADEPLRRKLAHTEDYEVCYDTFDWSVNGSVQGIAARPQSAEREADSLSLR